MCGLELPEIEASVWRKYEDQGVLVFGLHPGDPAEQVAAFVEQTGVTFPILTDANYTRSMFSWPDGVGYPYPRDIVIGKDGRVASIKNSFNVDEMDALITGLLAE